MARQATGKRIGIGRLQWKAIPSIIASLTISINGRVRIEAG